MGNKIENSKLPSGWAYAKLDDITIPIQRTNRNLEEPEKQFKYIDIESIDNHSQIILTSKFLKWANAPSRAQQILESNDILFATVRPYLKNIAVVTPEYNFQIASSGFCVLRIKEVNFKYVFYYIINENFIKKINNLSKGTSYPAVTNKIILDQIIPIAPLSEQNKIVSILDELFSELENGKDQLLKASQQLKSYRHSILKGAFDGLLTKSWRELQDNLVTEKQLINDLNSSKNYKSDIEGKSRKSLSVLSNVKLFQLKSLPKSWIWVQLGDISDSIQYGYTESSTSEAIGPKFLRITDIQENFVDWNTVPYCKIEDEKKEKYLLSTGDLVFARTGATVGKSYLIKDNPPEAIFASYLIRVRLIDAINHDFIYNFFQSEFYWRQITEGQNGTGQPNVNGSKLSELYIPLTSKKEQEEIVKILGSVMSKCDNLDKIIKQSIKDIENVKQIFLQNAFEGRLTDQISNEESANFLLEKIKVSKAVAFNQKKNKNKIIKPINNKKMAVQLKEIIDIMKENERAMSTKEVWQLSIYKDSIDDFYASLKKCIEDDEIIELPRKGKESFLKLISKR